MVKPRGAFTFQRGVAWTRLSAKALAYVLHFFEHSQCLTQALPLFFWKKKDYKAKCNSLWRLSSWKGRNESMDRTFNVDINFSTCPIFILFFCLADHPGGADDTYSIRDILSRFFCSTSFHILRNCYFSTPFPGNCVRCYVVHMAIPRLNLAACAFLARVSRRY